MTTLSLNIRDPFAVALLSFVLGMALCAGFFAIVTYASRYTGVRELSSTADGTGLVFASTAAYISDQHGKRVSADSAARQVASTIAGMTIQADAFFSHMSAGAQGLTVNAMRVFDRSPLLQTGDMAQARAARNRILDLAEARMGNQTGLAADQQPDEPKPSHARVASAQPGVQP